MELLSISTVSKQFNISVRTLRYYEQIGLIESEKKNESSYRFYKEDIINKLRQIIILRKLRIPLRQIAEIIKSESAALALAVFEQNLTEIEDEITALSTIRSIIQAYIDRLNISCTELRLLDDANLLEIVDSLTASKINFKEDKTMDDLNKANQKLSKLTDRDVRIVYLPPATVAAAHYIGDGPEGPSDEMIQKFIKDTNLKNVYPASRHYGFNHPNPGLREDGKYGYERWMTIPEDMEVPAPLDKKHFSGGLYAAYMILPDDLNGTGWNRLLDWAFNNKYWQPYTDRTGNLAGSGENMFGLLEEHLIYLNWVENESFQQVDLLLPITKRQ